MSLNELIKSEKKNSLVCTIVGEAGVGKTTLASSFPKPIIIKAEDGLGIIKCDSLPLLKNVNDLWEQLKLLINEKHDYKTVVIDSVTKLDIMFIDEVIASDPKAPKSINTALGGYGAGLSAVAGMHSRVRKAAQLLLNKGINVVFIAHADIINIELPDVDSYMKYDVRLGKKSVPYYVDDVDAVMFIKLETFTTETEKGNNKAMSDGTRVLVTYATASNVSKNRFGIKEDIILKEGVNPLEDYIDFLKTTTNKKG